MQSLEVFGITEADLSNSKSSKPPRPRHDRNEVFSLGSARQYATVVVSNCPKYADQALSEGAGICNPTTADLDLYTLPYGDANDAVLAMLDGEAATAQGMGGAYRPPQLAVRLDELFDRQRRQRLKRGEAEEMATLLGRLGHRKLVEGANAAALRSGGGAGAGTLGRKWSFAPAVDEIVGSMAVR